MINDNIIFLNDIKTYSIELLEYVKYNFINDEIIKEIVIYLESSLSEIDNINNYILELESNITLSASFFSKLIVIVRQKPFISIVLFLTISSSNTKK